MTQPKNYLFHIHRNGYLLDAYIVMATSFKSAFEWTLNKYPNDKITSLGRIA